MADILLHGEALARVDIPHVASIVAMAKKDLLPGEALDGIGGYCSYGLIDSFDAARDYLPMALSEYATLTKPVSKDQPLPLDNVELDESKLVVQEWKALTALWTENVDQQPAA